MKEFKAGKNEAGQRLDKYLKKDTSKRIHGLYLQDAQEEEYKIE